MAQADSVHSTPPTNTSAIDQPMFPPRDPTRRRFLAVAAVASAVSAGTLAAAGATELPPPDGFERVLDHRGRVWFKADCIPDPAFALIAEKRAADLAHEKACDAYSEAEDKYGIAIVPSEIDDLCADACHAVNAIDWRLANTPPTTLAGIAAVLRLSNAIEDAGLEWPNTDEIGPDGWHYQLRATMAAALETLLKKAVQS
jgi:hypothetical protein